MRSFVFIILLCVGSYSYAQTTFNGWFATNYMFKINSKFSMHLDVQARSNNQLKHFNTYFIRPGLNWHFRKNMIATVGYGLFDNRRSLAGTSGFAPEHRIWEQLIINHHAGFVPVQHRFRLEQRFITNHDVINGEFIKGGNRYANRIRYFNRAVISLKGAKPFTHGIFAALQNEVFLNIGNKSSVNGKTFDQNRVYLATGYRFSPKFDLEAGYINQYLVGRGDAFSNNHIVQIATYLRL
jgi:hypothetical protein